MASSDSVSTNHVAATSRVWYWDLNWWVNWWSGNTANIGYEVISRCETGGSDRYVGNWGFEGSIAGNYFSSDDTFYNGSVIASGSFNLGGGTYFEAWITAHPYSGSYTSSGSWSWTLDNNVVTPTVTVSIGDRTETTIKASMSVTNNGNASIVDNYIDLFTDSGCTNKVGTITGTSGTFTGLTHGTTYYARANASNGTYRGYSGVSSTSTYYYPHVLTNGVSETNLTIGEEQTLSIYNPLGRSITVYMKKNDTSGTQLYSGTTSSAGNPITYKFTPTASTLYNSIPDSSSGNCVYYCVYSDQNVGTRTGTYKVSGNNAQAPTFTNFSYKDTDTQAVGLTGKSGVSNPGVLIAGMSNCEFTVSTSQKATSSYGATLDKYNFAWPNGAGTSGTYSSSSAVTGTVQDGNTNKISVSAYDKRGQYKTVEKAITLISPTHAQGIVQADRQNGVDAATYLNGALSYWAGDWAAGSSRPNQLLTVEYRVNKTGSYYNITSAVTSNSAVTTDGNLKILTLNSNVIQLHADGSSGGFTVGTSYTVEIFVTTGYDSSNKYETRQKVAEITVTSGVFGMARYKGSDGKYHYGFNGLPHDKHTVDVHGSILAESSFNNHVSRLTSADIVPESDKDYGGFRHDVATADMTTNKPPVGDSHILTMFWDNSNRCDSQMAISNSTNAAKLTGVAFRGKSNGQTWGVWRSLLEMIYPIGSIYETTNVDFNPADVFGGTWTKIYNDYERIYIGSQRIREDWLNESGPVSKTKVFGAYGYNMFSGIFGGGSKINEYKNMAGYDVEVGLTAQISTGGDNHAKIYLNSKLMVDSSTWSGDDYRTVDGMILYKIDDIGQETVYSHTGVNLYLQNTGSSRCYIRSITIHGYLISKKIHYKWERTA